MAGWSVFRGTWRGRAAGCVLLVLALSLAACSDSPEEVPPRPTRTLVPPTDTPVPSPVPITPTPTDLPGASSFALATTPASAPGFPDDLNAALERAVDDLAASNAGSDGVRVLGIERFRWPDGSLGCASESANGAASPGDGYRLLLARAGEVVAYHTAPDAWVRCAPGDLSPDLQGEPVPPDPIAADLANLVTRDFAAQVGVDPADVDVTGLLSVIWPDTSLGCPRAGAEYAEQPTPGYRITVRTGEDEAIYHTNIQAFVRCAPDGETLPDEVIAALGMVAPPED